MRQETMSGGSFLIHQNYQPIRTTLEGTFIIQLLRLHITQRVAGSKKKVLRDFIIVNMKKAVVLIQQQPLIRKKRIILLKPILNNQDLKKLNSLIISYLYQFLLKEISKELNSRGESNNTGQKYFKHDHVQIMISNSSIMVVLLRQV